MSTASGKPLNTSKRLVLVAGRIALKGIATLAMFSTPWSREMAARVIAFLSYRLSARYREVTSRNLTLCFPHKTSAEITALQRAVFLHFSRVLLDFFKLQTVKSEDIGKWADFEGFELLAEARAKGKGVILLTAHLGNWELLGRSVIVHGIPLSAVARNSDDPGTTGLIDKVRRKGGAGVISRDSLKEALLCLRRNEALGILADQNVLANAIFIPFLGRLASTAMGPAMLAVRTGAAIHPCFCVRQPSGRWRATILPEVEQDLTQPDNKAEIERLTGLLSKITEDWVLAYPDQWLWLHDRWRRQPTEEELREMNASRASEPTPTPVTDAAP